MAFYGDGKHNENMEHVSPTTKEFVFNLDQKVTTWMRTEFTIEAENLTEAKELASPEGEAERWKFNYYAFEKPLLSNVAGSRKVMQVTLTIMTHYDERVIKNLKTHELALRAGILDVMRQKTDADLLRPDFRKALAEDLRLVINSLLEKYEGFGGIEEVMFTEFVVQ